MVSIHISPSFKENLSKEKKGHLEMPIHSYLQANGIQSHLDDVIITSSSCFVQRCPPAQVFEVDHNITHGFR